MSDHVTAEKSVGQLSPEEEREDMENIGRAFMEQLHATLPGYSWAQCPSEVICDLVNERDDAITLLKQVDGYLSRSPAEAIHAGSIFHQQIKQLLP